MKQLLFGCSLAVALLAGACQEGDSHLSMEEGYGLLQLKAEASNEVKSGSAVDFTVPEVNDFSLMIEGEDYAQRWAKFSDYVSAENGLATGAYTASIAWGDLLEEGLDKPAYVGSTPFTIQAQRVTEATITARLANALVSVKFTENFLAYFHDAEITLTTAAGNSFLFDTTTPQTVFIAPGSFTLKGNAFKQNGTQVDFPERQLTAQAQYRYTYTYDMSTAGAATITIRLDDSVVEEIVIDQELNPES